MLSEVCVEADVWFHPGLLIEFKHPMYFLSLSYPGIGKAGGFCSGLRIFFLFMRLGKSLEQCNMLLFSSRVVWYEDSQVSCTDIFSGARG